MLEVRVKMKMKMMKWPSVLSFFFGGTKISRVRQLNFFQVGSVGRDRGSQSLFLFR